MARISPSHNHILTQNLHDLPLLPLLYSLLVQRQTVTLPELIRFKTTSGSSILNQIGTRYWDFGVLLLKDDTGAVTQAIIDQYHEDAAKINREILQRWIQGQGMPVEWATLIEVLKDIGLTELAHEIEKKKLHRRGELTEQERGYQSL